MIKRKIHRRNPKKRMHRINPKRGYEYYKIFFTSLFQPKVE